MDIEQENKNSYRRLIVWQKADELAFQIYAVTKNFPKKEKSQFYIIARGSLTELEYYVDFSLRLKYIIKEQHRELVNLRNEVGRLLNGLIQSVKA